ncbi:hypothetical protein Ac2012v2_000010 [Leucoagaricus gongylophorus]
MAYGFRNQADQSSDDPHSSEAFKQNLRVALEYTTTLRENARRALTGIQNAYHVGNNPSQTQDDIATTKETLSVLVDLIERSGVGALPLLVATRHDRDNAPGRKEIPPSPPTEKQLVETTTKRVQVHFEKLKRAQESAAAVATNLTFPPVTTTTTAND